MLALAVASHRLRIRLSIRRSIRLSARFSNRLSIRLSTLPPENRPSGGRVAGLRLPC